MVVVTTLGTSELEPATMVTAVVVTTLGTPELATVKT